MSQQPDRTLSQRVRRAAIALIAGAAIAAPAAQAMAWKNLIVVPAKDLPQLARQGGRLAIFDVTDPAKVKDAGSVQLEVPGAFDFVPPVGDEAELIRFRGSIISTPVDTGAGAPRDYQVVDAANLQQLQQLPEVKQVRQQLDNGATGTTVLLTDEGLYLIRRPSAEMAKQFRDQTNAN